MTRASIKEYIEEQHQAVTEVRKLRKKLKDEGDKNIGINDYSKIQLELSEAEEYLNRVNKSLANLIKTLIEVYDGSN